MKVNFTTDGNTMEIHYGTSKDTAELDRIENDFGIEVWSFLGHLIEVDSVLDTETAKDACITFLSVIGIELVTFGDVIYE